MMFIHKEKACFDGGKRSPVLAVESGPRTYAAHRRLAALSAVVVAGCLTLLGSPGDSVEAKNIFRKRCTGCHTFAKGIKVGPDLKGVTERRTREWLLRFIRGSSSVIQSGDPTATKLFRDFKQERMPDWSDLSTDQVNAILDYFAANGPLQKEPDERDAATATAAEIAMGRQLFHGIRSFTYGGAACHACHSIRGSESEDGSLGPDLTGAYFKYRDRAMTDFLRHPCFARAPESFSPNYLTPQESFDLKAYMAKAGGLRIPSSGPQPPPPGSERDSRSNQPERGAR
jgi:mono/diheme cytochrome c family protein